MAKKKKPSVSKKIVEIEDVEVKADTVAEIVEEKVDMEENSIPELSAAEELTSELKEIAAEPEKVIEVADDAVDQKYDPVDAVVPPEPNKSRAAPLILGGVIAAVLGFTAARSNVVDNFLPPSWRMNAGEVALQEQITSSKDEITNLNNQLSDLAAQLGDIETNPELVAKIQDLADRVVAIEDRPVATGGATPDFSGDFDTLRGIAKEQQAEIDALLADARLAEQSSQEAASNTLARAAVTRIATAIESGAPFATALGDLEAIGVTDIPDELKAASSDGVVTLANLQDMIPDAARAALAASPADADAGLGGFLKRQLAVRSVAPKEGNDPDAILSRVEGAARQGRLTDALAEADTLPQEAKDAMSDWIETATTRLAVTSASEALMQRFAAN